MSNTKKFWWQQENILGSQKDMRNLLWHIAERLELNSPMGSYQWLQSNDPPFKNAFRQSSASRPANKVIFTENICNQLVTDIRQYLNYRCSSLADRNRLYTEINQQLKDIGYPSQYFLSEHNIERILSCQEDICKNKKSCQDCYGFWLKQALCRIEKDYSQYTKVIISEYVNVEQNKLVQEIYQDINNFEKNFKYLSEDNPMPKIYKLYNSLVRCWDMTLIKDERLAYIKWYSGRFCTWPFMKISLIKTSHYSEENILTLFHDAACILNSLDTSNERLLLDVHRDQIHSFIPYVFENPFILWHKNSLAQTILDDLSNAILQIKLTYTRFARHLK